MAQHQQGLTRPRCVAVLALPPVQVFTCARNAEDLEAKLQEWRAQGLDVQVRTQKLRDPAHLLAFAMLHWQCQSVTACASAWWRCAGMSSRCLK